MVNDIGYEPVECVNIPKMLFQDKRYGKLSADAKLLYSLLLDRRNMAYLNGWVDEDGEPYVIYPKSEMKEHMNASRYRVDLALEELTVCDQMVVVTQPNPGKPCQIYVKDITGRFDERTEDEKMSRKVNGKNHKCNEKLVLRPCMGIPGMQGMALFIDVDDLLNVLKDIEDEDAASTENEAAKVQPERFSGQPEKSSDHPEKTDKKADDISMKNKLMEKAECSANDLGCEIGDALSVWIGEDHEKLENVNRLVVYLMHLHKSEKYKRLMSTFFGIIYLFGIDQKYLEEMKSCKGDVRIIYLSEVIAAIIDELIEKLGIEQE